MKVFCLLEKQRVTRFSSVLECVLLFLLPLEIISGGSDRVRIATRPSRHVTPRPDDREDRAQSAHRRSALTCSTAGALHRTAEST